MHNVTDVKQAAAHRWIEILTQLGGVDSKLLDGNNHSCPKHCHPDAGGKDRFRLIDKSAGALLCNQCFNSKNGDGVAAIQWLLGIDFKTALNKIGDYLGLKSSKSDRRPRVIDPASQLEFVEWNTLLANLWCLKKKPIKESALLKVGAKQAIYKTKRESIKVIAIPTHNHGSDKPVGWTIYNITGGKLPRQVGKKVEYVKVKLTYGSKSGVIGNIDNDSTEIWKTEGPTDLLAFLSLDLPPHVSAFCNANGAKEDPVKSFHWAPG